MAYSPPIFAPVPENENARLHELHRYEILETQSEVAFDRIVRLLARHLAMPIALVSLIDRNRLWIKARYGCEAIEHTRDIAFCSHTILKDTILVVPNTTLDVRFMHNIMVTSEPGIRFYAGAPLKTPQGFNIGTLCVMDTLPHTEFSEEQKRELADMAAIVMDELELRLLARNAEHDLRQLQSTQLALENARERAERHTREKSDFIANISHELRTPLNGILGMAYLMSDTALDKTQREYVDTINHSAHNMMLLVNDVLDLSKIEAGELILEKTPFDVKTSITQTVKLLKPLAEQRHNTVHVHIEEPIPDKLVTDPGRFAQIITNLLGNAIKFTEEGEVVVRLRYDHVNRTLHCEVEDNGIGIPAQKRQAIFEKFVQGDSSISRKYGGTGLGLAITRQLVLMLEGTIDFESEEHKGSRFWASIPAPLYVAEEWSGSSPPSKERDGAPPRIAAHEARLLIVEDNTINQLFLLAILQKFGFTSVDTADNGAEAIEKIRSHAQNGRFHPYHAIFMDCKMPVQDGYETTRMIRQHEQESNSAIRVPVIAMTANALSADRDMCFKAGMDEYITKPLQPDKVKKTLTRWFEFVSEKEVRPLDSSAEHDAIRHINFNRLNLVAKTDQDKAALLTVFFRIAGELVDTMLRSRRTDEFLHWKSAAHSLKGAAGNMGMSVLEEACSRAERASEMTYEQRTKLLGELQNELHHIRQMVTNSQLPLNKRPDHAT